MEKTLGNIISQARRDNGLTVEQLISRLDKKVSRSYIAKVELQDEIPSREVILSIAKALKLDENGLLELAKEGKRRKLEKRLDRLY